MALCYPESMCPEIDETFEQRGDKSRGVHRVVPIKQRGAL